METAAWRGDRMAWGQIEDGTAWVGCSEINTKCLSANCNTYLSQIPLYGLLLHAASLLLLGHGMPENGLQRLTVF